jgi:hypothetical protein
MAKHYLDHDLPEEVKFVSSFISPKPIFHPYETYRPSSSLFKFKPCPSGPIFHDESLEKENFCAMDPPDTLTLELVKKDSTNEHANFSSNFLKNHARIRCLQSPSHLEPHALTRITTTFQPFCLEGWL